MKLDSWWGRSARAILLFRVSEMNKFCSLFKNAILRAILFARHFNEYFLLDT